MKQYFEMKRKHPDAILLFRVGDFYETFSEDAVAASEILGITLTRRANGAASHVELAGFPHHALDTYLPKLVRAGRRVAICEQLEDPRLTKKLVKRGITELVTPGVNTNDTTIDARSFNFLAGIHFQLPRRSSDPLIVGLAYLDITTGEFHCMQGTPEEIDKHLAAIQPKELLRMHGSRALCEEHLHCRCSVFELDDWVYTRDAAERRLLKHFATSSLKGFGIDDQDAAVIAAGSLLHYLDSTAHTNVAHITTLSRVDDSRILQLDRFTIRNLELIRPIAPDGMTLFDVLDRTVTTMGSRMLQSWIQFPLVDRTAIERRQSGVQTFFDTPQLSEETHTLLKGIGDLLRMSSRACNRRSTPRDLLGLASSLEQTALLRNLLRDSGAQVLRDLTTSMPDCSEVVADIRKTIHPDASQPGKGPVIAPGVSEELDRLRNLSANARETLASIERREAEATGITSLKIGFNNVFGYYIEVRNTHRDKVPDSWTRKQTLTSAERYITPELKELEQTLASAGDRIAIIESDLFNELLNRLALHAAPLAATAKAVSTVDCYCALATVATEYGYSRPEITDTDVIDIVDGRHPVIERRLPPGEPYVPNSLRLDCDNNQIMMITGPNMSGKSALLRQTALIVLLAHIGSFVPARKASIGIIDKIFTRVGASDNISSGESTFMVEMNEAAAILNNMGPRSLILFDELGRGTSTYDGISIAWAIVEHIHDNGRCRPKTLFATHYHELNDMEALFERIHNFNVAVSEIDGRVVFMRTLQPGGSEHSFGIHVARLAGMPRAIVKRADEVLHRLEASASRSVEEDDGAETATQDNKGDSSSPRGSAGPKVCRAATSGMERTSTDGYQLSLFQLDDPLLSQVRDALLDIDIDNLTPLQALAKLHDLQGLLRGHD